MDQPIREKKLGVVRLSVNINKVALIRNSRGENLPDLSRFAQDCELFGADGITVHPRPDERHIRYNDIPVLKSIVKTEFNIEGYPSEKFMSLVLDIKPDQCTLVPDPPDALTSSEGWDTRKHASFLRGIVANLKDNGIRVSLFLEADAEQVKSAAETGTDRIEFYTGRYAKQYLQDPEQAVKPHRRAAKQALELGLSINAGHDLNLKNLNFYVSSVYGVQEVSIGHALISDALYFGIQNTIGMYKAQLECK